MFSRKLGERLHTKIAEEGASYVRLASEKNNIGTGIYLTIPWQHRTLPPESVESSALDGGFQTASP